MPTKGQRHATPMAPRSGRQRMWASMRVLREFSTLDLVLTAEVDRNDSQGYVRTLADAGYLRRLTTLSGKSTPLRYRLVRNTGPMAPRAGKAGVLDINTKVFYPKAAPAALGCGESTP